VDPARNQMKPQGIERVVVINDDCVRSGGAASVMLASVEQLRSRGVPVTLITGDSGDNSDLVRSGVELVALHGRHILEGNRVGAALRGLYDSSMAAGVQEWIATRDTPGTIYHLHNWHKVLSPAVFVPLQQVASRLVISAHDYFLTCPNGGYYFFRQGKACTLSPMRPACLAASCDKRNYAHKLYRSARTAVRQLAFDLGKTPATVLVVHDGMLPLLERGGIPRHTMRVLRNPAMPWTSSRVTAEKNRQFLFVGRLEVDKGVLLLARAARRAGVSLRVIGSGPLSHALGRDFPEIELMGWKSKQEIAELSSEARALIMPSRWRETFGLVALEAAMSGIPIVASRAALITDDLVRSQFAVPFEADNEVELAQAMATLAKDDVGVETMSRNAFEKARALAPSPEDWCGELLSLYERQLADAKRNLFDRSAPTPFPPFSLTNDMRR
jgi:glycosyltransferase involved in cell wall biosynthesis